MSGTINNGQRLAVEFGAYRGKAGVQQRGGVTEVAFFASSRDMRGVIAGTIEGQPCTVDDVAMSDTVPGMVVLTVTAVTPGA